ncbi:CdaR family protein [Streptococcus merionis]|uniref:CdaR family protein n=1 Tax=Streptococcus merionis TaxID=400065 RepID=UPI0035188D4A
MNDKKQNLFFLAVSLILALFLFLYASFSNFQTTSAAKVTNSETFTNTIYNVPINLNNYDNSEYFVSGFTSDATVQLTSSNRVTLQKESQEATRSFVVTADFSGLESGTHEIPLKLENLPTGVNATVLPATITAKIGKRVSKVFAVKPEFAEGQVDDGVKVSSVTVKDSEVEVVTDEDTMSKIDHVAALLPADVTVKDNYTVIVALQAVDANGNYLPAVIEPGETSLIIKVKKADK